MTIFVQIFETTRLENEAMSIIYRFICHSSSGFDLQQPKELFTIRQRQTPAETRGVITLIGELDFETQSMYTLKMYATVRDFIK